MILIFYSFNIFTFKIIYYILDTNKIIQGRTYE